MDAIYLPILIVCRLVVLYSILKLFSLSPHLFFSTCLSLNLLKSYSFDVLVG